MADCKDWETPVNNPFGKPLIFPQRHPQATQLQKSHLKAPANPYPSEIRKNPKARSKCGPSCNKMTEIRREDEAPPKSQNNLNWPQTPHKCGTTTPIYSPF